MPYIDPITGAYVDDSLNALPPGYNQPKANNEANVAKMRAALNTGWDDNTPLPQNSPPSATDPFSLVQQAYQHMPGASFAQGVTPALLSMPQFLASLGYGLGNQVVNPQTSNFDKDTTRAMQALQYTPPTQAGRDISEGIGKVAEAAGPLPELWGLPPTRGFTPDDLRVAGKTATEDFRNFGSDYANAKAGVQREYPTAGSRAAQFTDVAGDLSRPLAEKAYDMYMNPESSVEVYGMRPGANLSGLATAGSPMYAVKPGGGNNPLNMGSTNPLEEQGKIGRHLSETQISDPLQTFKKSLEKHYPPSNLNAKHGLMQDWKDFLDERVPKDASLDVRRQLEMQFADEFANEFNAKLEPHETQLPTISDIERIAPAFNTWTMKPYQKYLTTQMGTGLPTDPYLQQANQADVPLNDLFGLHPESGDSELAADATKRRERFLRNLESDSNFDPTAPQNVNVGKQTATTPNGRAMEDYLDKTLYPSKAMFMNKAMFPALNKIPEDALVTDFLTADPWNQTGLPAIQKKVFNDLISGKVKSEDVTKLTPATILKQIIDDYKKEQQSKDNIQKAKDTWRQARFNDIQSAVPYDDGSKMHIIGSEDVKTEAGKNLAFRDLGQNTIDLNQCIGAGCMNTPDYSGHGPYIEPHTGKLARQVQPYDKTHVKRFMDRLEKGETEIARLLDPNGVAQASVELKVRNPKDVKGTETAHGEFIKDWLQQNDNNAYTNILDFGFAGSGNTKKSLFQKHPDLEKAFDAYFRPVAEKQIQEMKGKDNGKIAPEYIPQMVEWLNSMGNELTDVRDFDKLPSVIDQNKTYDSIGKIADSHPHWDVNTVENFLDKVTDENLLPRFFTTDDFALKATERGVDLSEEPKKKGTKAIQEAYEKLSQELRLTYEDPYLQEYINGDPDVRQSVNNDIYYHPEQYGMSNYTHGTVMEAVQRLRDEGLHTPGRELENVAQQFEAEHGGIDEAYQGVLAEIPRLSIDDRDMLDMGMDQYFDNPNDPDFQVPAGRPIQLIRILAGNQNNGHAQLPRIAHQQLVNYLLNQDDHVADIVDLRDRLERGDHFLNNAQADNMLRILTEWLQEFPLHGEEGIRQ